MRFVARIAFIVAATFIAGIVVTQRYITSYSESNLFTTTRTTEDKTPLLHSNPVGKEPYSSHSFLGVRSSDDTYTVTKFSADDVSPKSFVAVSSSVFALGAAYDAREGNMGRQHIRVLLVARPHRNLMCRFPNGTVIDGGKLYEMSENHAMIYGVYFLNCPLPANESLADRIEVKIATKTALWRSVPIIYDIPRESDIKEYKYELTICLPFLFGRKYSAEHFIEVGHIIVLKRDHTITCGDRARVKCATCHYTTSTFYEKLSENKNYFP
ncbi:unnamed protein product [Haemonchus placei]|uniref:Oxidored_molyb domain-containing protein n=1 Tax=Haemonchus placei TaxID=6290 RepID=A0A0N4WKA8_HAEPC|nr:unnamed protein product [Haemonchus placei]